MLPARAGAQKPVQPVRLSAHSLSREICAGSQRVALIFLTGAGGAGSVSVDLGLGQIVIFFHEYNWLLF